MMNHNIPFWRKASQVFHDRAVQYDQWYEDSDLLFRIELDALQRLKSPLAPLMLELGVGPGRFAAALGVAMGIDPAFAPLKKASRRGVASCQAVGEYLPVRTERLGTIFLLFTLCFLEHPQAVLAECFRALKPQGFLVLGMVPASSPWGKLLQVKKEQKHPFYRYARFYETAMAMKWLEESGFEIVEKRFTLMQPPDSLEEHEPSQPGLNELAGFVVLVGKKESRGKEALL